MAIGKQLSDANSDGTCLGQSTTDKIGFFGLATPIAQQSLAANGTDAATTQALANDLKAKLKALGLCG
jgi:hypothetical protein